MLYLVFELGGDRYAIDTADVVEVLPLVELKSVPQAPRGVAGLLNLHAQPVPVIDLSELMLGRPAAPRMGTRVVLVQMSDGGGRTRLLGLIAEHVAETVRRDASDFVAPGIENDQASYLGPVAVDRGRLLQRIDIGSLLPASVRAALFDNRADL